MGPTGPNTPLRAALKRLYYSARPGPKWFRYFGCRVYFPQGSHLFDRVCRENIYERANVDILLRLIGPGTAFLDAGANLGLMALPALRHRPECRVLSFEPSPGILPYLRRTREASGFGDRWEIIESALGAAPGEAEFFTAGPGLSAFDGLRNTARKGDRHAVRTPVTTLDAVWSERGEPRVSALKIDVEGGEADVLRGGERMLTACHPAVLLEWNPSNLRAYACRAEWLLEWARARGYRIYAVASGAPVEDAATLFLQGRGDDNFLLLPAGWANA